jgi:hypothetical protein
MPAKNFFLFLALLLLAGCATQRIPFNESEFADLQIKGDKTVTGQVFLVDQLEEKQVGENTEVTLEPVTSYSTQWYEISYLGNRSLKKADSRYNQYVLRAKTNPDGDFTFNNVAPGEYYLSGTVNWKAATCSGNVVQKKVPISLKITVNDSDSTVEVPLTKKFESPTEICGLYNQADWEKVGF